MVRIFKDCYKTNLFPRHLKKWNSKEIKKIVKKIFQTLPIELTWLRKVVKSRVWELDTEKLDCVEKHDKKAILNGGREMQSLEVFVIIVVALKMVK